MATTVSGAVQRHPKKYHHSKSFRVAIDLAHSYGPLLSSFESGPVDRCFMLISPNTPYENRVRLEAVLEWLSLRCLQTVVVDGAYLDRWNLECVHGLSPTAAATAAKEKSQRIERRIKRVLSDYGWSSRVEFWDYRKLLSDSHFKEAYAWLKELLLMEAFRKDVDEYVAAYLSRRADSYDPAAIDACRLRNYVLEEIALSITLHAHGLPAECYAGPDFHAIEQMMHGVYGTPPSNLENRTFVSLIVEQV